MVTQNIGPTNSVPDSFGPGDSLPNRNPGGSRERQFSYYREQERRANAHIPGYDIDASDEANDAAYQHYANEKFQREHAARQAAQNSPGELQEQFNGFSSSKLELETLLDVGGLPTDPGELQTYIRETVEPRLQAALQEHGDFGFIAEGGEFYDAGAELHRIRDYTEALATWAATQPRSESVSQETPGPDQTVTSAGPTPETPTVDGGTTAVVYDGAGEFESLTGLPSSGNKDQDNKTLERYNAIQIAAQEQDIQESVQEHEDFSRNFREATGERPSFNPEVDQATLALANDQRSHADEAEAELADQEHQALSAAVDRANKDIRDQNRTILADEAEAELADQEHQALSAAVDRANKDITTINARNAAAEAADVEELDQALSDRHQQYNVHKGWTVSPQEVKASKEALDEAAATLQEAQTAALRSVPSLETPDQEADLIKAREEAVKAASDAYNAADATFRRNIGLTGHEEKLQAAQDTLDALKNEVPVTHGGPQATSEFFRANPGHPAKIAAAEAALASAKADYNTWLQNNGVPGARNTALSDRVATAQRKAVDALESQLPSPQGGGIMRRRFLEANPEFTGQLAAAEHELATAQEGFDRWRELNPDVATPSLAYRLTGYIPPVSTVRAISSALSDEGHGRWGNYRRRAQQRQDHGAAGRPGRYLGAHGGGRDHPADRQGRGHRRQGAGQPGRVQGPDGPGIPPGS